LNADVEGLATLVGDGQLAWPGRGRPTVALSTRLVALGRSAEEIPRERIVELDPGAAAVTAPILDRCGRLAAGLSVAGPSERIGGDPVLLRTLVVAAARGIERAHPE
jgi:hypothetical protein